MLSRLSSLELSHSPEVRPAVVVQLGLSIRGQLQVTHLTQRVGPALTWDEIRRMAYAAGESYKDVLE